MALCIAVGDNARSAASEPPCPPAATVEGPAEIVEPVKAILASHGVRATADGACRRRAVRAEIERRRDRSGFTLTTVDDSGRTSTRFFVEARTAASLIESWTTDEDAALLAPMRWPATENNTPSTPITRALVDDPADARVHMHGGAETSLASDGSWWFGAAMGACARVGAICAGARLRSIRDSDMAGASRADTVFRTDTDVLLTASWLLPARRIILAPTLAAGAGWLRTRTEGGLPQDAIARSDRTLRTELSLLARWPLGPHVALATEIGATWSPWAHTADHVQQRAVLLGEPEGRLRVGLFCVVTP